LSGDLEKPDSATHSSMNMKIDTEFVSIGGNRNPAAADWDETGLGLLAFGADNNIALWDPLVSKFKNAYHANY
jgi:hypothetical protein